MGDVICDAGPLIHLDDLDSLDLLRDFGTVVVPTVVWREAIQHRPGFAGARSDFLSMVEASALTDPRLLAFAQALLLGAGEQAAIAEALARPRSILLTDDAAARLAAEGVGIAVHGTLGVIVRSIRRGLRSREAVIELLQSIPDRSTLHVNRCLLAEVIESVGAERTP